LVDFLVGKDLTIGVEPYNNISRNIQNNIFVIKVKFLPKNKKEFEFNPSAATVILIDHKAVPAKGLPCSKTRMDLSYLRSAPSIIGSIPIDKIDKNSCFYLFFDVRPPTIEEEFTLKLGGITKLGQPMNVPDVIFRKGGGWDYFGSGVSVK